MFREMRLKEQQLSEEQTIEILERCTNGALAINGEDGYPYSVPVSYVYADGKIYIHGAIEGYKNDLIKRDGKVSFSVVALDDVQPDKFTTFFRSVIVYGTVRILEDPVEIQQAMEKTLEKYSSAYLERGRKFIKSQNGNFCVYELSIDHMTGKRSE